MTILDTGRKIKMKKEPVPRIVTETAKWIFTPDDLAHQHDFLSLCINNDTNINVHNKVRDFIYSQIRTKIAGYKVQDKKKGLFCDEEFVNEKDVLDILHKYNLHCYYCKETAMILYSFVREPKQWTLERLDNDIGHNRDNVVLSCLQCNLRRRCILSERYVQTKEMSRIVKLDP